jgi:hypothetical protein
MSKMLIDRAAVEQALKTIESWNPSLRTDDDEAAVTALRAALEQPEQEPVGDSYADLFNALQRIETAAVFLPSFKITHEGGLEAVVQNIVDAIAALAQEEQEPVAWRFHDGKMWCYVNHLTDLPTPKFEPLYIHPPSREWQRDELLAALKLVRDRFFPEDQPVRDRDSMWGPVNAAIEKAEGAK